MHHVCAIEGVLLVLHVKEIEVLFKDCLLCRFYLASNQMIREGRLLPQRVYPDTIVYTKSCLYACTFVSQPSECLKFMTFREGCFVIRS